MQGPPQGSWFGPGANHAPVGTREQSSRKLWGNFKILGIRMKDTLNHIYDTDSDQSLGNLMMPGVLGGMDDRDWGNIRFSTKVSHKLYYASTYRDMCVQRQPETNCIFKTRTF